MICWSNFVLLVKLPKFTVQAPENNTQEINQKFEQEKEEAVKKAKEIMKVTNYC